MVFLYLSTVIPSIWFLELSLLQSKLPVNVSSGPELHLLAHIPIAAVGVAASDHTRPRHAYLMRDKDFNLAKRGLKIMCSSQEVYNAL